MENKCNKYETLFLFSSEKDLYAHLKECAECAKQAENDKKLSMLIQEAKNEYFKRKGIKTSLKTACAITLLILCTGMVLLDFDCSLTENIKYGKTLSAGDYGFPVDSYGLITVGE